jgi:hypothetical protein
VVFDAEVGNVHYLGCFIVGLDSIGGDGCGGRWGWGRGIFNAGDGGIRTVRENYGGCSGFVVGSLGVGGLHAGYEHVHAGGTGVIDFTDLTGLTSRTSHIDGDHLLINSVGGRNLGILDCAPPCEVGNITSWSVEGGWIDAGLRGVCM